MDSERPEEDPGNDYCDEMIRLLERVEHTPFTGSEFDPESEAFEPYRALRLHCRECPRCGRMWELFISALTLTGYPPESDEAIQTLRGALEFVKGGLGNGHPVED